MRKQPYQFIVRAGLAMAPLAAFVLLLEALLWLAGEAVPIETIALKPLRTHTPAAYLPAFIGQQFSRFHYERIKHLRPAILVAGSSRVMRFRQEMFGPEVSFYNSSRLITSVKHLEQYVAALPPDYAPQAFLLGVDSWWFNGNHIFAEPKFTYAIARDDTRMVSAHLTAYRRLLTSICQARIHPALLARILRRQNNGTTRYGFLAWEIGGFRNDGSFQEFIQENPNPGEESPRIRMQKTEAKLLARRPNVDPEQFQRFIRALKILQNRGTTVIGFSAPFRADLLQRFSQDPFQAGYFADFRHQIAAAFRENGWHFFDGSEIAAIGLDDTYLEDIHHPTEICLIALLHKLSANPDVRKALRLNPDYLQALLAQPIPPTRPPDYSAPAGLSRVGS